MTDMKKGAIFALASSLLMALLFAYIFRIPIPLGGYIGPFSAISTYNMHIVEVFVAVLVAWVFYGIFGGFIILPLLGAVTGEYVGRIYAEAENKNKMILLWSFLISAIPVFILSILDYLIGPW